VRAYQEKFAPRIAVRTSPAGFKMEGWLILPLYAVEGIRRMRIEGAWK